MNIALKCDSPNFIKTDFLKQKSNEYKLSKYIKTSNIRHLEGNKIVDHSDVVGASPVGDAPTTSSFPT